MTKIILIISLIALSLSCGKKEPSFQIAGQIQDSNGKKVSLYEYQNKNGWVLHDTCIISGDKFSFAGSVEYPVNMALVLEGSQNELEVFIENSKIRIDGQSDNWNQSPVKGSSTDEEYKAFLKDFNNTFDKSNLEDYQYDSVYRLEKNYLMKYVRNLPESYIAPYILCNKETFLYTLEDLSLAYSEFSENVQISTYGQELEDWIKGLERQQIGAGIMDLNLPDTSGQAISTQSLRGKFVFVDFWSSSCGPCRKEHPKYRRLYDEYKEKGFEIYAVSLDTKKTAWQAAIKKDSISWIQVSDLKGNQEAKNQYMISFIPQNFLYSPDGKLIAKGLNGDKLRQELEKVLD